MASEYPLSQLTRWVSSFVRNEILLVAAATKPAARFRLPRRNLPDVYPLLDALDLQVCVGFQSLAAATEPAMRREWTAFAPQRYSPDLSSFVYVSRDPMLSEALRAADERCDHVRVGRLLGYPECCILFFCEIARSPTTASNPVFFAYPCGASASWMMNVCLFDGGLSLLSHAPCSPHCLESLERARLAFEVLFEADPNKARKLSAALCATTMFGTNGSFATLVLRRTGDRIDLASVLMQSANFAIPVADMIGSELRLCSGVVELGLLSLPQSQYRCYHFN